MGCDSSVVKVLGGMVKENCNFFSHVGTKGKGNYGVMSLCNLIKCIYSGSISCSGTKGASFFNESTK